MKTEFKDKVILVTGGTGSFGRRFAHTVLERYDVRKLIVYSRDEMKQYEMAEEPFFREHKSKVRFFIGDVRDLSRLEMAFRDVDYVVHAAALKHITVAEYNPFECIRTNVHGAENVVTAAIRADVKRVVALSTDKAANPINLYGASKLASDKIFVAARALAGLGDPKFAVVRYGNVAGSRGSVIPFFRNKLAGGATTLPITDPRMTRFWITLQQGVDFVLSCFDLMTGGEIFVPKIPSMKVVDLAGVLAPGVPTEVVGIRPGEKLHEVMITSDEARFSVELPDRYVIAPHIYGPIPTYHDEQKQVHEDFSYASHTNDWWLNDDEAKRMLEETLTA